MSSFQNDCKIEANSEVTEQAALAMGIPGVICLALSIVGLIAELLFVCKKKNNFLLRLYIYLSVAVLLFHVTDSLYLIISVYPQNGWLCEVIAAVAFYQSMVEFFFIISVNCVLLYKVYTSVRRSCYHCHESKATEVTFVVAHFIIPLIIVGVLLGIAGPPIYWPSSGECHLAYKVGEDCNRRYVIKSWFKITTEYIPVAIGIPLSILCICTLSIWLCWLLRKHFLRARMKTILKEMGLLLGYLSSYSIIRIVIEILNVRVYWNQPSIMIITFALYPINKATVPLSFIVYICFIYLCPPRSDKDTYPPTDQHTHPPSTRVSLPSNTADHAPNFLSESTFMDSSYIHIHVESKRGPTEATALLMAH